MRAFITVNPTACSLMGVNTDVRYLVYLAETRFGLWLLPMEFCIVDSPSITPMMGNYRIKAF